MQSNKTDVASNVNLVKHESKRGIKPADRKPTKKYCGGSHLQAKSPVYGKKCNICFKNNYFVKICKQRKTVKAVNINESSSTSDNASENEWFVESIEIKYENKDTVDNDKTNITETDTVENPVSESDEIKNTAPHSIKSKVSNSLPDLN